MSLRTKFQLACIFLGVLAFDTIVDGFERLDVNWLHYLSVTAIAGVALGVGIWFGRMRRDYSAEAMLIGIAFLIAFAPACALIPYLGSGFHGPRIDEWLARLDHAFGFDWPSLVAWSARYAPLDAVLSAVYALAVWQVFALAVLLGWRGEQREIGRLCIAIAFSGIAASLFWIVFPSFGAVTVFWIPQNISALVHATVDNAYGHRLVEMLAKGPGRIDTQAIKGVVGFPSFHAAEAIVTAWSARRLTVIFPCLVLFNVLNSGAMLIQGGHHLADLFGGAVVAACAIMLAGAVDHEDEPRWRARVDVLGSVAG